MVLSQWDIQRGVDLYTLCAVYFHHALSLCLVMMQESRLTTLQKKQINECLKSDLEKEKRRLQNILSTGHNKPPSSPNASTLICFSFVVLDEIEERRQFLADMASLGQEKKYINIINTEISQKIRELETLDKARSSKKDAPPSERKESSVEQMR
uniref:Uncharacterized protein n=1 Tax=Anabas testudineus TaxID=64144 RepID=A0A7N6FBQ4_ANATE